VIQIFQGCAGAEESLNEENDASDNVYSWSINEEGEFRGTFRTPSTWRV